MSLSSHLGKKQSRVRGFLEKHFPDATALLQQSKRALADAHTIEPPEGAPLPLIGTALDYRLRCYFGALDAGKSVARKGAAITAHTHFWTPFGLYPDNEPIKPDEWLNKDLIEEFFADIENVLCRFEPVRRRLAAEQEQILATYCIALGCFEQIFRTCGNALETSPLMKPKPKQTIEEILSISSADWINDMCRLSWAFFDNFGDLICNAAEVEPNPKFDGSVDIRGADADLIIDGCLVDIKTSIRSRIYKRWLYQLLGYTLLDYSDRYKIRELGIYLSRQGILLRWKLSELMDSMSGGAAPSLVDLRNCFREVVLQSAEFDDV